jgi:hypothetical protein
MTPLYVFIFILPLAFASILQDAFKLWSNPKSFPVSGTGYTFAVTQTWNIVGSAAPTKEQREDATKETLEMLGNKANHEKSPTQYAEFEADDENEWYWSFTPYQRSHPLEKVFDKDYGQLFLEKFWLLHASWKSPSDMVADLVKDGKRICQIKYRCRRKEKDDDGDDEEDANN